MRKLLAILGVALVLTLSALGSTAVATPSAHSWYVCKYVGQPGNTEVLQTGQNPIFVDEHAIATFPNVAVGDDFADAQGHSLVIAGPYAPPGLEVEPTCPTTPPPTETPPPPTETPPPPPPPTSNPPPPTSTPPTVPPTSPPSEPSGSPTGEPTTPWVPTWHATWEPTHVAPTAFTGAEQLIPGALGGAGLLGAGLSALWYARKRKDDE